MQNIGELSKYLPTQEELAMMSKEQFTVWVENAYIHLPQREQERDPLFMLKKRISSVLKEDISEDEMERVIYRYIAKYFD